MAYQAERAGFDAYVIGTSQDPGLWEARALASIPVLGYGETAFHFAAMTGRRFAVVGFIPELAEPIAENLRRYGLRTGCLHLGQQRRERGDLIRLRLDGNLRQHNVGGGVVGREQVRLATFGQPRGTQHLTVDCDHAPSQRLDTAGTGGAAGSRARSQPVSTACNTVASRRTRNLTKSMHQIPLLFCVQTRGHVQIGGQVSTHSVDQR